MVFKSGLEVVKGDSTGKLVPKLVVGSAELGILSGIKLGNVSEGSEADGIWGTVDGTAEWDVKLRELAMPGSRGGRMSGKEAVKVEIGKFEGGKVETGKFGPGKFETPVSKVLKLGYCIGCCMEEGIASPGGGRSKDCWCKCGSPFGGA